MLCAHLISSPVILILLLVWLLVMLLVKMLWIILLNVVNKRLFVLQIDLQVNLNQKAISTAIDCVDPYLADYMSLLGLLVTIATKTLFNYEYAVLN